MLFSPRLQGKKVSLARCVLITAVNLSLTVFSFCYRTYTEYVPFPEKIPISVAVGRHARNLRSALPKGLQCIVVPTDGRPDKREVALPKYKHSKM